MKKIKLCLLILGISILTLVSFTPQTQAKKTHNNVVQNNKPWNKNKSQILNQFMSDWGKINDYDLVSYIPNNNIDFGGTKYPANLNKQKITVDHKKYTAGWSNNGTGKNDYNVIGCYSDGKPNQIVGHSLYLFAFHKNKPVILMVNDGQKLSKHGYEFVKAGNPELTKYFEKIINGKDAAKEYKQATSTERLGNNTPTQQQAVSSQQAPQNDSSDNSKWKRELALWEKDQDNGVYSGINNYPTLAEHEVEMRTGEIQPDQAPIHPAQSMVNSETGQEISDNY